METLDAVAREFGSFALANALVIGFLAGWIWMGTKAAKSGRKWLAWVIGMTPPALLIIALFRD